MIWFKHKTTIFIHTTVPVFMHFCSLIQNVVPNETVLTKYLENDFVAFRTFFCLLSPTLTITNNALLNISTSASCLEVSHPGLSQHAHPCLSFTHNLSLLTKYSDTATALIMKYKPNSLFKYLYFWHYFISQDTHYDN